jgi:hypothetical protein
MSEKSILRRVRRTFSPACATRADDPDRFGIATSPECVRDHKHAAARRAPNPQEPRLRRRVLQVWAVERVGIEEDGHGVVERDVVLRRVGLSLSRVPPEHLFSIYEIMSRDHLRRLSSRGSCTTGKDDTARRFLSEVTCGENPRYRRRCPASCNDNAAKHAISDFVERVTLEGVPNFVPCRPASCTFDNDGSLWAEKPVPLQVLNAFDRVSCLAPEHPN